MSTQAEPKKSWTPELMAEHKAMMSGVPEGKEPPKGAMAVGPDKGWQERSAYRKAFEDHVSKFLMGDLKNAAGDTVQHREEALTHAHLAGKQAVQQMKKTGIKFSVFADGH